MTGVTILQFYGSNETGMLSATTLADPLDRRLRSAGRIVPEMQVRLFDGDRDVTDSGRGQPACRGPALSLGYLGGTDHDKLFPEDGWMRMGDICELDSDGYLTVTGRTSDFILRGGKNVSAVQVEEAVATHPAVAIAAAVAMHDTVLGERICVFVELKADSALDLPALAAYLLQQGVSKGCCPSDLKCSVSCLGHPVARSRKANFARPFEGESPRRLPSFSQRVLKKPSTAARAAPLANRARHPLGAGGGRSSSSRYA